MESMYFLENDSFASEKCRIKYIDVETSFLFELFTSMYKSVVIIR